MNITCQLKVRKRFWLPILALYTFLYSWAAISPKVSVRYVYYVCPVFICYNDTAANFLMKDWMAAVTRGFIIISREENFADKWGEEHEIIHAKQVYRSCMMMPLAASISKRVLLEMEAEAYAFDANNEKELERIADILHEYYFEGKLEKQLILDRLNYHWSRRKDVSTNSGGARR